MIPKRTAVLLVVLFPLAAGYSAAIAADAPPGASSCSGCHPASRSVDTPVKRLVGAKAADIVSAVQEFRSGKRPATVMDRIAKGFSDDEIEAIADWYGAQKD
ncbi:MAG TPA: cytochrome C [Xanthobacteraceae bacterium]|jgi:sulfide dehydrogenase cytochrome subunit|nr:cytochrome C [Xanthobacteraceae bacterium]